jgi:L-Ala-D/L-Glu epimerase
MDRSFDHASARRAIAESVLVQVRLDPAGSTGWGEGAPRGYVTGENLGSTVASLSRIDPAALSGRIGWDSFESAVLSIAELPWPHLIGARPAPAATAALEIALLDGLCRMHGRSLVQALQLCGMPGEMIRPDPGAPIPVTLVLDLSRDPSGTLAALPHVTRSHLRHVKVKASRDVPESMKRYISMRAVSPPSATVSLDVNGAWPMSDAVGACRELQASGLAWIEEPLRPRSWEALRRLRDSTGINIMLDESFMDEADLERVVASGCATHLNLRISKCGGVLRTARLAGLAHSQGLGFQLGVHVGEVGPLWAAGRALAAALSGAKAVEGGRQDEWFAEPLTSPAYKIDRLRHQVVPLDGPGTGVRPAAALVRHARTRARWSRATGSWRKST